MTDRSETICHQVIKEDIKTPKCIESTFSILIAKHLLYIFFLCMVYSVAGQIPLMIANGRDFNDVKDTPVKKKGRATGETEGILVSDISTVFVTDTTSPISPIRYRFDYCYEIKNRYAGVKFFEPGDSGSGVYLIDNEGRKKAIGIAFAHRFDGTAYACRIEQITKAFNVSLYDVEETPMDTS